VAETIEYEQFDHGADAGAADPASQVDLSRLSEIPMELSVEIGRTHMTVGETLDLCVGSVVTLERLAGETADLLVNGSAIARGEVVVIDEQYGLRITEILDSRPDGDEQPLAVGSLGDAPRADAPPSDAPLEDAPLEDAPLVDAELVDEPVADQSPAGAGDAEDAPAEEA
jgi:flagellar motor switch protein FliN/FliY